MTSIRTAAVVHLDRLSANIENIQKRLHPGVEMIAVVKGDAYGHGIPGVLPIFKKAGISRYACAVWEEGASLREAGAVSEPIYLLGDLWDDQLGKAIEYRLTPTIFCLDTAQKLNILAEQADVLQPIQLKVDTGMSRIGFAPNDASIETIKKIAALPHLKIVGAFTHFACADDLSDPLTQTQYQRFLQFIDQLRANGVAIPFLHVANSPAILLRPEVQLNAVRAGDAMYGLSPVDDAIWPEQGLQEVITWETYVALVKTIPAGSIIGYGATFTAEKEMRIATIPVGFADGYDRHLSNRGAVIIRGKRAPIVGRVCMDQFMVDVSDIPDVSRGDQVTLLGEGMTILDMANLLDQNVDEVVCHISKRVPRIYTQYT